MLAPDIDHAGQTALEERGLNMEGLEILASDSLSLKESGQDGIGGVETGENIGDGETQFGWRAIFLSGDMHKSGLGLED